MKIQQKASWVYVPIGLPVVRTHTTLNQSHIDTLLSSIVQSKLTQSKSFSTAVRKLVLLTTTNAAFLDFTDNWLESIRRVGPLPFTVIVREDDVAFDHLINLPDTHVLRTGNISTTKCLLHGTPKYKVLVNKRAKYILDLLKDGYDVVFNDVDSVWLQDPLPYLDNDYDLCAQLDQYWKPKYICAGFMYYKSCNNTIQLVEKLIDMMKNHKDAIPDNTLLNTIIRKRMIKNLKLKHFDANKFLSGMYYFDDNWRRKHTQVLDPVMIHNTFAFGHDSKVERFQRLGLWYVNYTIPEGPKDVKNTA